MKITDLKASNKNGGSATTEVGDVKITTKDNEKGYYNISYQDFIKRKTETQVEQYSQGTSFDLLPISNDSICEYDDVRGYSEVFKLNVDDFIVVLNSSYNYELNSSVFSLVYISNGVETSRVSYEMTFAVFNDSYEMRAVTNYNNVIYFFKQQTTSINQNLSNKIFKINIDQINKTLSTIEEISTVNRNICKAFYNKSTNQFITYENNVEIDPISNPTEIEKFGIFKDVDFENINVLTNSTPFFSLKEYDEISPELFIISSVFGGVTVYSNLNNLLTTIMSSINDDFILLKQPYNGKYTIIENFNKIDELVSKDIFNLLGSSSQDVSVNSMIEYKEKIIIQFNNGGSGLIGYFIINKTNKTSSIFFKNGYSDYYILINDSVLFPFMTKSIGFITFNTTTEKRTVFNVAGQEFVDLNNIYGVHSNFYSEPINYGENQYINNEDDLYMLDIIGSIENKTFKLCKINYSFNSNPFVIIKRVENTPQGLNYLLKV